MLWLQHMKTDPPPPMHVSLNNTVTRTSFKNLSCQKNAPQIFERWSRNIVIKGGGYLILVRLLGGVLKSSQRFRGGGLKFDLDF